jgi:DNA helicase-2/ATP-dependent DNA helicase PcrA
MWQNDKSIEAPGRLENLKELIHALEEFESLGGFLEHVSLVMENAAASDGEMITIMTLHGAKGLEFDVVFLPGWEEGLFPSQRSLDENGMKGLEEERRLAYVGLTRAKKRAYISFAANRRVHNMWQNALPSRFIAELPKAHVEREENEIFRPSERYVGQPSGWGRQPPRDNFRSRGDTLIDLRAEPVTQTGTGRYPSGAKVFHQKFGYGKVLHSEGDKLEIAFEKAGVKKVMAGFVVPAEKAG